MDILNSKTYRSDIEFALRNNAFPELRDCSILITGGLGLIGSAVVDALVVLNEMETLNIKIFIAARNREAFVMRYGSRDNIHFVQYDAMSPTSFSFQLDYIIIAAGVASPELYVTMPVETILSNIIGVKNLLEYSKLNNVKKVLYISSSEVYGNKDTDDPFVENKYGLIDIDNIRSSYAEAKRASEMLCKGYSNEYGLYTVIARPGHIYGPTASRSDQRISSVFAYKAAEGGNLEMKSSGLQNRSYVYCVDCAMAVLSILLHGEQGEAYNISNEEMVTIREMAKQYAMKGGVKLIAVEPSHEEKTAFNPMNNSSLNNKKLKNIGYTQSFSPKIGFSNTVKILREALENNL